MANAIDLIVSKEAQKQLDDLLKGLTKTHEEIVKISKLQIDFAGGTSPKNLSDMNSKIKEFTKNQTELTAVEKERIRVAKQLEATQAKIATANDKNTQSLAAQRGVLRVLGSAYAELSQKQAESARRVQDLIARGKSATQTQKQYNLELKNAQNEFNKLNQRVLKADTAVDKFNRNVGNYPQRAISGVRDLIGAFGVVGGLTAVAAIGRDIFNTTKELQSLDLALKQVTGTNEVFAESQAFLADISERFGVEINGLTKQFTQFYVSAKDKISGKEIQGIFESVAKSAGFMGLSVEAQDRAFVALNQMMSKGTVSAEELKGQLGEALPGAFGIMAKAMGTTEQGLAKLMKDGKVLASEVLPKFAKELEKAYGIENKDRVESLAASQTRLSNAWTGFIRELNEGSGVITKVFSGFIDWIAKAVEGLGLLMATEAKRDKMFGEATQATAYKEALKSYEAMTEAERKLQAEFNKREILEDIRETVASNKILIAQGKEIEKQRNGLTTGVGRELLNTKLKENNKLVIANNQSIYFNRGLLAAANEVLKESTDKTGLNTGATDANTKAKKEQAKAIKEVDDVETNSKDAFERNISAIEGQLNKISILNPQYEFLAFQLKIVKDAYKALYGEVEKSNEQVEKRAKFGTEDFFEGQIAALKAEQAAVADSTEQYQLYDRMIKSVQDQLDALRGKTEETGDAITEVKNITNDFLRSFQDAFAGELGFTTLFQVLNGSIEEFGDNLAVTMVASMEIMQEAFNFMSQVSERRFQEEIARLETQRDLSIQFAGESISAREAIETQYEQRRRQLERRKAEEAKRNAIFNLIIDTAQAVVGALAEQNYVGAVLFAALGAAQIALVSSTPVPAYAEGTDNHSGGAMLINDGKGSNYTETVQTPDGKLRQYKGRNVMVNAPKGTKVFNHDQWQDKLNGILSENNILYNRNFDAPIINSSGITESEFNAGISKLANVIQSKESITLVRDEKGERIYKKSQGVKEQMMNARLNIKGYEL